MNPIRGDQEREPSISPEIYTFHCVRPYILWAIYILAILLCASSTFYFFGCNPNSLLLGVLPPVFFMTVIDVLRRPRRVLVIGSIVIIEKVTGLRVYNAFNCTRNRSKSHHRLICMRDGIVTDLAIIKRSIESDDAFEHSSIRQES